MTTPEQLKETMEDPEYFRHQIATLKGMMAALEKKLGADPEGTGKAEDSVETWEVGSDFELHASGESRKLTFGGDAAVMIETKRTKISGEDLIILSFFIHAGERATFYLGPELARTVAGMIGRAAR
jgi:hypothetical protein